MERLLTKIDYAHNILPFYGFLHHAGALMMRLSPKTRLVFTENLSILRSITFGVDNLIKILKITGGLTKEKIDFILQQKLHLLFAFDLDLKSDVVVENFKTNFLDQLDFVDRYTFKRLYFRLAPENYYHWGIVYTTDFEPYNEIINWLREKNISLDITNVETYSINNPSVKTVVEYMDHFTISNFQRSDTNFIPNIILKELMQCDRLSDSISKLNQQDPLIDVHEFKDTDLLHLESFDSLEMLGINSKSPYKLLLN